VTVVTSAANFDFLEHSSIGVFYTRLLFALAFLRVSVSSVV